MSKEKWKVIPNTNNRYEISNHGRVYSNISKIYMKFKKQRGKYIKAFQ